MSASLPLFGLREVLGLLQDHVVRGLALAQVVELAGEISVRHAGAVDAIERLVHAFEVADVGVGRHAHPHLDVAGVRQPRIVAPTLRCNVVRTTTSGR